MNIEQKAAEALLERGIKVPVTAPLLLRIFRKRTVNLVIGQPYLGTLYRISKMALESDMTAEQFEVMDAASPHELYQQYLMPVARIIATGWLNGKITGRLFTGIVARWLRWHLTPVQLFTCAQVLVIVSSAETFMNTIRLTAGMKMTTPNLSPKEIGS